MQICEMVSSSVFFLKEDFERCFPDEVIREGILSQIVNKQVCSLPQLSELVEWLQTIIPSELAAIKDQEEFFEEVSSDIQLVVYGVWVTTPDNKIQRTIFRLRFPTNKSSEVDVERALPGKFENNVDLLYALDVVPLGHI